MARVLSFITACRIDSNCEIEMAEEDEAEEDRNSRENFGLKIGLALSFIAMTVAASYIPSIFMGYSFYNVCILIL